jgi:hypothetical protein
MPTVWRAFEHRLDREKILKSEKSGDLGLFFSRALFGSPILKKYILATKRMDGSPVNGHKPFLGDQSEASLQDCPLCVGNLPATSLKPSRSSYCLHCLSVL